MNKKSRISSINAKLSCIFEGAGRLVALFVIKGLKAMLNSMKITVFERLIRYKFAVFISLKIKRGG